MVGKVQALVGIVQACLHSVKSFKSVQMCMIRYFCICILHSLLFHFSSSFLYVLCYKKLNGSWWKKRTLLCFRRCALSVNWGGKNHKRGPRVTSLTRETVRNNKHIFAKAPFWLKLEKWFWWRRLLNFVNVFLQFCYYLSLERAWPFIWTNLNSLHKDSLCHIWLKLVQCFWRRRRKFE